MKIQNFGAVALGIVACSLLGFVAGMAYARVIRRRCDARRSATCAALRKA